MKYIKTFSHTILTTGSLGILLASGLSGCGNNQEQTSQEETKKGAFVIIEETAKGEYKIKKNFHLMKLE